MASVLRERAIDLHLQNVALDLPTGRRLFSIPNLHLPKGSHVLLRGASGTGKSSLLHLMAGLMKPSAGVIRLGDQNLSELSDEKRSHLRREHLGLIFQKLNLLSHLTVSENVSLSGGAAGAVADALKRLRIEELAHSRASVLSGGEQQRVAVARVLAQAPFIILADEPTSSLDDVNAEFVIQALKTAAQGKTLIVVSHDDRLISKFKDIRTFESLQQNPGVQQGVTS